ncbi:hypothetical protein SRHO_G00324890 [Serrasalmus rhombeus]
MTQINICFCLSAEEKGHSKGTDDGYPLPMAYSVLRSHWCQKWDIRHLPGEAEPRSDNGINAKMFHREDGPVRLGSDACMARLEAGASVGWPYSNASVWRLHGKVDNDGVGWRSWYRKPQWQG